jgi:hypothetical protein
VESQRRQVNHAQGLDDWAQGKGRGKNLMGAYEVNGTQFLTIGSGRRWNVYRKPVTAGKQREAGPFESRSAAIKWARNETKVNEWQAVPLRDV